MKYLQLLFPEGEITGEAWYEVLKRVKQLSPIISKPIYLLDVRFSLTGNKLHFFLGIPEDKTIVFLQEGVGGDLRLMNKEVQSVPRIPSGGTFSLLKKSNLLSMIEDRLQRKNQTFVCGQVTHVFGVYKLRLLFQDSKTKRSQIFNYFSLKFPSSFLSFKISEGSPYKLYSKQEELDLSQQVFEFSGTQKLGRIESPLTHKRPDFYLESFNFRRHTSIVGQTGVGKSKFIELVLQSISHLPSKDKPVFVLIDPHDTIANNLGKKIAFKKIDFQSSKINLFFNKAEPTLSSELALLLFETLIADRWNDRLKRLLRYTLFLLSSVGKLEIDSLKAFLTDISIRKKTLKKYSGPNHVLDFFDTEFIEFQTKFYNTTFIPILNLVEELSFVPALSDPSTTNITLEELLNQEEVIIFSLNRMKLGNKATQMLAGMIIQYVFLVAQSKSLSRKIVLAIDEVALVENKALPQILSESRKFNLGVWLIIQYLHQLSDPLRKSLLTNTYNWFAFKTSAEDASILIEHIDIPLHSDFAKKGKELGFSISELKEKLLTSLNPTECFARIYSNEKFVPGFKMRVEQVE